MEAEAETFHETPLYHCYPLPYDGDATGLSNKFNNLKKSRKKSALQRSNTVNWEHSELSSQLTFEEFRQYDGDATWLSNKFEISFVATRGFFTLVDKTGLVKLCKKSDFLLDLMFTTGFDAHFYVGG